MEPTSLVNMEGFIPIFDSEAQVEYECLGSLDTGLWVTVHV